MKNKNSKINKITIMVVVVLVLLLSTLAFAFDTSQPWHSLDRITKTADAPLESVDANNNGVIDEAENAEKLGGFDASDYVRGQGGSWAVSGDNVYRENGNVGIGTATPEDMLHLVRNAGFNVKLGAYSHLGTDYSAWTAILGQNVRAKQSTTYGMELASNYKGSGASAINLDWDKITFHTASASDIASYSEGSAFNFPRMTIANNGDVGIGTSTPAANLEIENRADGYADINLDGSAGGILRFLKNGINRWGIITENADVGTIGFYDYNAVDYKMVIDGSGNVGIGTRSPGSKLTVDGAIENAGHPTFYTGVARYSGGSSVTGTMKITLPKYGSNTMMTIKIVGYDYYTDRGAWELVLGGYNYGGDHLWRHTSADLTGNAPFNKVRFANDGSKDVILLGTTTTNWRYPKIVVTEVMAGYSGYGGWGTGWTIAPITSESNIASNAVSVDVGDGVGLTAVYG